MSFYDKYNDGLNKTNSNVFNKYVCIIIIIQKLCRGVESAHQTTKSKKVYATIKTITKMPTIRMQTIKSKDGKVLTDKDDVKER